jgi:Family of unknown function (DUF5678)
MSKSEISEHDQRMSEDFAWARNAAEVQQNPEHFGKLVAVYDKRVVGFGRDRQALIEQAAKQTGVPGQHIVVVLVPRPGLWEIPH